MNFRFPENYLDDFFKKKISSNGTSVLDKDVYKSLKDFINNNKKTFPPYIGYLNFGMSDRSWAKIFSRTEKDGTGKGKGHSIEEMDAITSYLTEDKEMTSLFIQFDIDSTVKLKKFIHPKSLKEFQKIQKYEDILKLYNRWGEVPDKIKNKIKEIKIDHIKKEILPSKKEDEFIGKLKNSVEDEEKIMELGRYPRFVLALGSISLLTFIIIIYLGYFHRDEINEKDTCYQYQKLPDELDQKTAPLRILILPFKGGKSKIEKTFECMLYGKFYNLIEKLSFIDKNKISTKKIEIILGNDNDYKWKGGYERASIAREIAKDYSADYIVWGEYVREDRNKLTKATYSIMGLWTGEKLDPFDPMNVEYANNWSGQVIFSELSSMNRNLKGLNKHIEENESATFYRVQNISSKEIENHFREIMYYEFLKSKNYEKAYQILEDVNSIKSLLMQTYCLRKNEKLIPIHIRKLEKKIKEKGYSSESYELIWNLYNVNITSFHTIRYGKLRKQNKQEWKIYLKNASSLADSCIKYASGYYTEFYEKRSKMMILDRNKKAKIEEEVDLVDFYITKGHNELFINDSIEKAIFYYEKRAQYKNSLPISLQRNYQDADIVHFLMEKGVFDKAEEYIVDFFEKKKINESSISISEISYLGRVGLRLDTNLEIITNTDEKEFICDGRRSLECQMYYLWSKNVTTKIREYFLKYSLYLPNGTNCEISNEMIYITFLLSNYSYYMASMRKRYPFSNCILRFLSKNENRNKVVNNLKKLEKERIEEFKNTNISFQEYRSKIGLLE